VTAVDPKVAVEGNRSSRSYLEAAVLCEELFEFGALWHGTSWGVYSVLDAPPAGWDGWEKTDAMIDGWRPRVQILADSSATLEFAVLDPVGAECVALYRYAFPESGYDFTADRLELGHGGPGIIF
jgi:hypothetical protein